MQTVTVKDGIRVTERKIPDEYTFLRSYSYFSVLQIFISNTKVRLCTFFVRLDPSF
jgi:hypothetical protein